MTLLPKIVEIILLGIIGGAVPGPIMTAVFTEVLNGGLKKSFWVMMKALSVESIVAGFILFVFFAWEVPTAYFYAISFGGAIVLFWLAKQVWGIREVVNEKKEIFSFPKIMLLTILNGGFWIFWITICVPRAFDLSQSVTGGQVLFWGLFESGWLFATAVLAYVFSKFRPLLLKKKLVSTVFKVFALLLVFFGLKSAWGSLVYFLAVEV
jgi:threonine/homoserine/homoserine lactone efflux protein